MIIFEDVTYTYPSGSGLFNANIRIDDGEFVYLIGPTGSGKTTIMRLIYMDLFPTSGNLKIQGISSLKLKKRKIAKLRIDIGMIFQDYKLLTDRTVYENVALPLHVLGTQKKKADEMVMAILMEFGLVEQAQNYPRELSGGELQRACIARGLVKKPHILLADEPTGNLDPASAFQIIKLLEKINANGTTVLMASHDYGLIKDRPARFIEVQNGIVHNE
jgi:cell division transport system ATP-binding protein